MINLLSKIWKLLGNKTQWVSMYFLHAKFNVGLSIIIPDDKGEVPLGEHVFSGKNAWRLLGGYINKGENIYDAAKREVKEEIGIDIEPYKVLRIRSGFSYRIEITLVARPVTIESDQISLDTKEITQIGWFAPGLEPINTLESHKYLLRLWKEKPEEHIEIKNL